MKHSVIATVAALVLASPSLAETSTVKEVDVTFELQAIESAAAAGFWADLEGDLESAVIARLADRLDKSGAEISIDINEFDMSNSFQSALGAESSLAAEISIRDEDDPTVNTYYDLIVKLQDAGRLKYGEKGVEIQALSENEAYGLMIDAFADNVVAKLQE